MFQGLKFPLLPAGALFSITFSFLLTGCLLCVGWVAALISWYLWMLVSHSHLFTCPISTSHLHALGQAQGLKHGKRALCSSSRERHTNTEIVFGTPTRPFVSPPDSKQHLLLQDRDITL